MANTTIRVIGAAEVEDLLSKIPESSFRAARRAMQVNVFAAHRKIIENISGHAGGWRFNATQMNARTGNLKRSIRPEVAGTQLSNLKGAVYSASGIAGKETVYARIHELGGTVEAKDKYKWVPGGPYLNIPMGPNFFGGGILTPAGVPRYSPKQAWNIPSYRDMGQAANLATRREQGERGRNARAARGRRGEPIRAEFGIMGRTIKTRLKIIPTLGWTVFNERFGPMYRLVKQVKIPPRLGMRKTSEEQLPALMNDLWQLLPIYWRLYDPGLTR